MTLLANTFTGKMKIILENFSYSSFNSKFSSNLRAYFFQLLNIINNFRKLLRYGTTDIFDEILIETTTWCNRRCLYCPNSLYDRGLKENEKIMPDILFKKIIDDLSKMNFRGRLSPHLYGEPLLDKRLPKLLEYAHNMLPKARIEIFTNADFLDIDMLLKLYDAGVCYYKIALHSSKAGEKERVGSLIEYIKKSKLRVKIETQVFDKHTPLSTRSGLIKAKNIAGNLCCIYPLAVNYKGDVLVCCNDYFGESAFGNLENENLLDIWNKPVFRKVRKELGRKIYSLDICKRCVNSVVSGKSP